MSSNATDWIFINEIIVEKWHFNAIFLTVVNAALLEKGILLWWKITAYTQERVGKIVFYARRDEISTFHREPWVLLLCVIKGPSGVML